MCLNAKQTNKQTNTGLFGCASSGGRSVLVDIGKRNAKGTKSSPHQDDDDDDDDDNTVRKQQKEAVDERKGKITCVHHEVGMHRRRSVTDRQIDRHDRQRVHECIQQPQTTKTDERGFLFGVHLSSLPCMCAHLR